MYYRLKAVLSQQKKPYKGVFGGVQRRFCLTFWSHSSKINFVNFVFLIELGDIEKRKEREGMRSYQKIKLSVLFVCCVCLSPVLSAKADIPAATEWVDIPVVVNIIDASDANNVDTIIKKANEILEQAHIRLVVKKTNNDVNVGNGDGDLTEDEGDTAQEDGQKELDNVCGAGKGIKITIADDVWAEDPNTTGWSVHRNPVIFVEPDTDPNARGRTAAHELGHVLTLADTYDINDINDLMYGYVGGGTTLGPNDVNEIFGNAKKRGKPYFVIPRVLPGRPVAIPCGIDFSIDAHGAILDGFYDQAINPPLVPPVDPTITYTDLREIILFCDEPFDPNGNTTLEIQLGGTLPEEFPAYSFFDVFFTIEPEGLPAGEVYIEVGTGVEPWAIWRDFMGGPDIPLPPPTIHRNEKFDGPTTIIRNDSLEVTIPTEIIAMNLVSAEPIVVNVNSYTDDYRVPDQPPIVINDFTEPFEFGLNHPCTEPKMCFIGTTGGGAGGGMFAICAFGFPPNATVDFWVDGNGEPFGSAETDSKGTVTSWWKLSKLEDALRDPNDSNDPNDSLTGTVTSFWANNTLEDENDPNISCSSSAGGYFIYCGELGDIAGDLDNDCDVDWFDFAKLADNWLAGKEPEP